jgi:hypothetical protein
MTRKLWTIASGKCIGYIENVHKHGVIYSSDHITFRMTSSNLSDGITIVYNTCKLTSIKREELQRIMERKVPVVITYKQDVILSPLKGLPLDMCVYDISQIEVEKLNIVQDSNKII